MSLKKTQPYKQSVKHKNMKNIKGAANEVGNYD